MPITPEEVEAARRRLGFAPARGDQQQQAGFSAPAPSVSAPQPTYAPQQAPQPQAAGFSYQQPQIPQITKPFPISSYSIDPTVALDFAHGLTNKGVLSGRTPLEGGVVFYERVPIDNIMGGLNNREYEVLVVDPSQVRALSARAVAPSRTPINPQRTIGRLDGR